MTELGITKGEWVGVEYAGYHTLQITPFYGGRDLFDEDKTPEAEANMTLCCDAGNTYQQCGLLPSELLRQRDELLTALKEAMTIIRGWHGMGMEEREEEHIWEIYNNKAPEMQRLNAAIKSAEK